MEEQQRFIALDAKFVGEFINYLATKPYSEVKIYMEYAEHQYVQQMKEMDAKVKEAELKVEIDE